MRTATISAYINTVFSWCAHVPAPRSDSSTGLSPYLHRRCTGKLKARHLGSHLPSNSLESRAVKAKVYIVRTWLLLCTSEALPTKAAKWGI